MILLDTHVWLRVAREPERLSRRAASTIRRHERTHSLAISSLSLWEAAWLRRRGRLSAPGRLRDWLMELVDETRIEILAPTLDVCATAAELPAGFPGDPFDRLIAATAISHACALVTADERLRSFDALDTIW